MDYHAMRKPFEPATVKLVMLAESPPASGKYFYNAGGSTHEALFEATMAALDIPCESKAQGLREFQRRGVLLLDMTYTPVNEIDDKAERAEAVERDYDKLVELLSKLPRGVPVVIMLAGIYDRFANQLRRGGFNIVKSRIPFPTHKRERIKEFCEKLASIAAEHGI
jgi:uracil DNA glycosylase